LRQEHPLEVAYATVHRIVAYELKAKLTVPRPRHQQQAQGAPEDLKKTPSPPPSLASSRGFSAAAALLFLRRESLGTAYTHSTESDLVPRG
ncbi:MAG: hypothetical protein ACK4IR_00980, partial [Thermosynechococcus sp.]